MRGHMLEVELLTLDPKTFDNLQDLFTKYKDLLSQFKACGVDKSEEKQMVLTILFKLGSEYSIFVSTFHSVRLASGATWKMPSLEVFIESLTRAEQAYQHGKNQRKEHALIVHDGSGHQNQKSKDKDKRKAHANPKKGTQNPSTMPQDPKVEREEKGRNALTAIKDSI
jgi:hypothetical protein